MFDLFSQSRYLHGPAFEAHPFTSYAPWLGILLAAACLLWRPGRRPAAGLLALLHYGVTYSNGMYVSEADPWIWLMAIALVGLPDEGEVTRSLWVGALKLIGFCVYLFAGLYKTMHHDWWTGEAMQNVYLDPYLMNPSYAFLARSALLAQALCLITLFQRLVLPWGFWSKRLWVRRACAGALAVMHYSYVVTMNIGTFSWVGMLYLSQYLFPTPGAPADYYRLPPVKNKVSHALAAAFALYVVALPTIDFVVALGPPRARVTERLSPPGFLLNWSMFANIPPQLSWPIYSVKTCSGKELVDDEVYWSFGSTGDYFRRRMIRGAIDAEMMSKLGGPGPIERHVFAHFPEKIEARRVRLLEVSRVERKLASDSGYLPVSKCN